MRGFPCRLLTTTRHVPEGNNAIPAIQKPSTPLPPLSSRPAISTQLPPSYTFYKNHNDFPLLPPPPHARIYDSKLDPPHVPRSSLFHYLFPPKMKGRQPQYYPHPDPKTVAFIDGQTGRTLFRSDLPIQAMWTRSGLRTLGVVKGDVACIFGENSLEWVSACYAAQAAAMVVSPVNNTW